MENDIINEITADLKNARKYAEMKDREHFKQIWKNIENSLKICKMEFEKKLYVRNNA